MDGNDTNLGIGISGVENPPNKSFAYLSSDKI
jgi:hypothetical protein